MSRTLHFASARIAERGVLLTEWSFAAPEHRIALIGADRLLVSLLLGTLEVSAGEASICEAPFDSALSSGAVGVANCHAPLLDGYRVGEMLALGAQLVGLERGAARRAAARVLAELALEPLATRRVETLSEVEKRGVHIAKAVLTAPRGLVVDRPFQGLDELRAAAVRGVLERATADRRLVLVCDPTAEQATELGLLEAMDRIVRFAHGELVANGPPSEVLPPSVLYSVTVTSNADAFLGALPQLGIRVVASRSSGEAAGAAARLIVELPQAGDTDPLVEAALSVGAPLVELLPIDPVVSGSLRGAD